MDFAKSEQAKGAMNRTNILPHDGLAYLVDETGGEFEWPKVTACLAATIPMADRNRTPVRPGYASSEDDGLVRRC
jgi:hypothetical protein